MSLPFKISYSAWSLYKKSQLEFYFKYIAKAKPTNTTFQVYGDAGNVVHKSVEEYIKNTFELFDHNWEIYKIDEQTGFCGAKLSKKKYREMFDVAIVNINDLKNKGFELITEKKILYKFYDELFIGFIDLIYEDKGGVYLQDWKTNSTTSYKMHEDQRIFYSWLISKIEKYDFIDTKWYYLKQNIIHGKKYDDEDIKKFDNIMQEFIIELTNKGNDISKYEIGNYKNPFNCYYDLCKNEAEMRNDKSNSIILEILGNQVLIKNAPKKLLNGIDLATRFDLPNKYWMQKKVKEKGGFINLDEIGRVHLFNQRHKCFPIGLLKKVKSLIAQYNEHYKTDLSVQTQDKRDQTVMNYSFDSEFLYFEDKKLRKYQHDGLLAFCKHNFGIIKMPTGSGKTFLATEIIKVYSAKTLWICDRKELLIQTKNALEEVLGEKIGIISDGTADLSKQITIATIQSLKSKLEYLRPFLYNINFAIVDEYHKAAAESYQIVFQQIPNTKFRLGITATTERDDGKTPILQSILGDIIYSVNVQDLINQGYLMKPSIIFLKIPRIGFNPKQTYTEDYKENIVFSMYRGNTIQKIVNDNYIKKIIILTKSVEHGKMLKKAIPLSRHIHGRSGKDIRKKDMEEFRNNKYHVLIMTQSIGKEGLDIPDLDIIINAAANKGQTASIQVLGRVLRIAKNKKSAIYYDFVDVGVYTHKHSIARIKALEKEEHEVKIEKI